MRVISQAVLIPENQTKYFTQKAIRICEHFSKSRRLPQGELCLANSGRMVIFAALKSHILHTVNDNVKGLYGGQIRVRACGICVAEGKILLINHSLYGQNGFFWSPPGGGIHFGETAQQAVVREFKEETGLDVKVGPLLFFNEHIADPLHAIELFFEIKSFEGTLTKGIDPEFSSGDQIIRNVCFMSWQEISRYGADQLHNLFSKTDSVEGILRLDNYIN